MRVICAVLVFWGSISFLNAQDPDESWFTDVSVQTSLDDVKASRIYVSDVNGDDYPDLLIQDGLYNRNQLYLYINTQDPNSGDPRERVFIDFTEESGINANRFEVVQGNKVDGRVADNALLADLDNDGDNDLVSCIYYHRLENNNYKGDNCECLLNDGNGKFTIASRQSLYDLGAINSTGIAALDYDLDGVLDLYITTWSKDHSNNRFSFDRLLRGMGNEGHFLDLSKEAGLREGNPYPNYGLNMMDYNNDGYADMATSPYCRSGGKFWENQRDGTFIDVADSIGYNAQQMPGDNGQPACQWAAHPSDFDNDGDVDYYISLVHGGNGEREARSTLVINKGPDSNYVGRWDRERVQKEIPYPAHHGDYDAEWMDINNDGLVDLVTGQGTYNPGSDRLYIFLQQEDHYFDDITFELDLWRTRQPNNLSSIDFDMDGDDDLIFQSSEKNGRLTLLRNNVGQNNNHISVKLDPPLGANKSGVGARISVHTSSFVRNRDIYLGEGNFGGQRHNILNFGVGSENIDSIVVNWPNLQRDTTVVRNPEMNKMITIAPYRQKEKEYDADDFVLFPNPARNKCYVQIKNRDFKAGELYIYDLMGNEVFKTNYESFSGLIELDVSAFNPGYYILRYRSDQFDVKRKFIKQ